MVDVVQLVRASDCGSECRGFESHLPPNHFFFVPLHPLNKNMVDVVQLVRASDCGSECRGFESHLPPNHFFFVPLHPLNKNMVDVVQLVRASDCGSECRGFESHLPPKINPARFISCRVSCCISVLSGNSFLSYKRIAIVFL